MQATDAGDYFSQSDWVAAPRAEFAVYDCLVYLKRQHVFSFKRLLNVWLFRLINQSINQSINRTFFRVIQLINHKGGGKLRVIKDNNREGRKPRT